MMLEPGTCVGLQRWRLMGACMDVSVSRLDVDGKKMKPVLCNEEDGEL